MGRSAGLALLWDKSTTVQLQSFGPHHIDVTVYPDGESEAWRFTGFYGFADTINRQCSWELLSRLKILSRRDCRPLWQIRRFREALASTDLHDLGYEGRPFTWCNQYPEPDTIYEKLDRACADPSWRARFPNAVHIPVASSDHDALLIDLVNTPRLPKPKRRPFRFEAMWASLAEYEQVVRRGWNGDLNCSRPSLVDRQRSCAAQLHTWSTQNDHCSIQNKIQTFEKALPQIRRNPITAANKIEENRIRGELELLMAREENAEGRWLNEEAEIQEHIEAYFGEIFRSRNPSENDLDIGTEAISVRIFEDMLLELSKPYTAEEVSLALSQMAPLKSPGPDASKTIANRLKPIIDAIISPCQAAFVPGRLIKDNVLLAFEVNHYLNTKKWGKKGHMAVKLDISKAYDKVEWKFLERVLVSLALLFPKGGSVKVTPFPPTYFCCAQKPFLHFYRENNTVVGYRELRYAGMPHESPTFCSPTDSLIFCQATVEAASSILDVLGIFGRASGQEINFAKSSVVFSSNTNHTICAEVQDVLQIRAEGRHDLYLGLPTVVGKSRRAVFQSICDRVWQRINGWNERNLSQAGKEILIKAVAQTIPTYAMGCFCLPASLIKEIQSMIANFWWHSGDTKKIHWLSWHKLSKQKLQGGMGFRDLQAFNLAMLAKQLWRIISNPDSLLSRVLLARYFPHGQVLEVSVGRNPSFT
ncbi:UNVERIFIED_CONTAM: putative mitochondrial protein [Sesamum angustifolium]|uniref:Mitochondrial protein n=1 Tax=Sesamum angustifolium TaxID=2727405 RepID=A0AAW2LFB6_9LAMI